MIGGYGKNGTVYCVVCTRKTDLFDVQHSGAEVIMNAMKYPVCGNCIKRKDELIIKAIKERKSR